MDSAKMSALPETYGRPSVEPVIAEGRRPQPPVTVTFQERREHALIERGAPAAFDARTYGGERRAEQLPRGGGFYSESRCAQVEAGRIGGFKTLIRRHNPRPHKEQNLSFFLST